MENDNTTNTPVDATAPLPIPPHFETRTYGAQETHKISPATLITKKKHLDRGVSILVREHRALSADVADAEIDAAVLHRHPVPVKKERREGVRDGGEA